MNKIKFLFSISIIKTIRFNAHYFGIKSLFKNYVLVSKKMALKRLSGKIILLDKKPRSILLGFGDNELFSQNTHSNFYNEGEIIFSGRAAINQGSSVFCKENSKLFIGKNFCNTANLKLVCSKEIKIGDDSLLSWDITIMDTDFHKIYDANNKIINEDKGIIIGDHCWICCNCTILKGSVLPNYSIIGANSLITKRFTESNCLIINNAIIKKNINWKK